MHDEGSEYTAAGLEHKEKGTEIRVSSGVSKMQAHWKWISTAIAFGMVGMLLVFFVLSRNSRRFEMKMVSTIRTHCPSHNDCLLHLQNVTDFQWDKMFVFGYDANESEIAHVLGTNDNWGSEFQRKIIFTYGGKVVFHEEEPTDVEHPVRDEVVFNFPPNSNYAVYTRDSIFKVTEKSSDDGPYYELNEVH